MAEKTDYKELVDHCFGLYEEFKGSEYRKQKLADIEESYRVYNHKESKANKYWEGESKLVLPLLSITVDNMEPRLYSGLVGKAPIVQLEPDGMNEQDTETEIIENWFNDELLHTVQIKKAASTIIHKAMLEGTLYPICEYDEDDVKRRKYKYEQVPQKYPQDHPAQGQPVIDPRTNEPVMVSNGKVLIENGEPQTEDVVERIFMGGRVRYTDFKDVYVADDASDWEASDVIRTVRITYGELYNKRDAKGYIKENINKDLLSEQDDELSDEDEPVTGDVKVIGKKVIECLECSIRYIDKNDKPDEEVEDWSDERCVILIAKESRKVLRKVKLIDLNFKNQHLIKRVRLYGEEGKAYGTSMFEKLKAIQNGATDLYNQVINVATICMIPWFLYTDASGAESIKELKPGVGIKVDDPSQVNFPKFNQNPRSYIVFIEMFMQLWERVGSIGDIQMGRVSQGSGDTTATETMAAIQEGNIKHNYQSLALKSDFLEVIRTLYDLYYQNLPFETVTVYKGKAVPIQREAMERRQKFKLIGSTDLSNKILGIQQATGLYDKLRPDPLANHTQLIADMIDAHKEDSVTAKYMDQGFNQLSEMMQQDPEFKQVLQQTAQQYMQQKNEQSQKGEQDQNDRSAQIAGTSAGNAIASVVGGQ